MTRWFERMICLAFGHDWRHVGPRQTWGFRICVYCRKTEDYDE